MTFKPVKKKYQGTFNISGEVVSEWGWAYTQTQAQRLFLRKLAKRYGRKIYLKDFPHYEIRVITD